MTNRITFLGTGTSQGVPMIGCKCPVCTSADIKDKRLRASLLVEYKGLRVVIDAGPDFRQQMLRENVDTLDAILLTHEHKDHTGGLDDVRAFNYFTGEPFPIYSEKRVQDSLKMEYHYVFDKIAYPGVPQFELHTIDETPFSIKGVDITPIRAMHYKLPILGYKIGNMAYLTDANNIEGNEIDKMAGVDLFIVNCIRREEHISHFNLSQALHLAERVGAGRTFLTHISHQLGRHEDVNSVLPGKVRLSYDGLCINFLEL